MRHLGVISIGLAMLAVVTGAGSRLAANSMGAGGLGMVPVILLCTFGLPLVGIGFGWAAAARGDRKGVVGLVANVLVLVVLGTVIAASLGGS